MPITKKQYLEAMSIVTQYCFQIQENQSADVSTIGCRVKLSAWGLQAQGTRLKKRRGKIIDYIPWIYPNQGSVIVLWDGKKKPDGMHESQVEPEKTKP
jgi:hypothetical protein